MKSTHLGGSISGGGDVLVLPRQGWQTLEMRWFQMKSAHLLPTTGCQGGAMGRNALAPLAHVPGKTNKKQAHLQRTASNGLRSRIWPLRWGGPGGGGGGQEQQEKQQRQDTSREESGQRGASRQQQQQKGIGSSSSSRKALAERR
jgi:hypothetical protein